MNPEDLPSYTDDQGSRRERIVFFLQKHPLTLLLAVLGSIALILILFSLLFTALRKSPRGQAEYNVVSTAPRAGQEGVFAGELAVQVKTDEDVAAPENISLEFSPPLENGTVTQNVFPSKIIQARVLGGLKPNTKYTVRVHNHEDKVIYTWSFTTSDDTGESASGLRTKKDQQINEDYYPLTPHLPYSTKDYLLGYTGHKKLKITLVRSGVDRDAVLKEVRSWVKSNGVDPDSHEYVFSTP